MSTDHRMVIMDSALNCADAAGRHIPTWPQRKVQRFVNVHEPTKEQIGDFNSALANSICNVVSYQHIEQQGQQLIEALKSAAEGAVAMTKWEKCPKSVNKLNHCTTQDYKLRQWRRKLVAVEIAPGRGKYEHKLIKAVSWKLDANIFEGLEIDKLQDVPLCIEQGYADDVRNRLVNQIKRINTYLQAVGNKVQREKIRDALKTRNELFGDQTGKGKGCVLARIMRRERQLHDITVMQHAEEDADGTARLAYT